MASTYSVLPNVSDEGGKAILINRRMELSSDGKTSTVVYEASGISTEPTIPDPKKEGRMISELELRARSIEFTSYFYKDLRNLNEAGKSPRKLEEYKQSVLARSHQLSSKR